MSNGGIGWKRLKGDVQPAFLDDERDGFFVEFLKVVAQGFGQQLQQSLRANFWTINRRFSGRIKLDDLGSQSGGVSFGESGGEFLLDFSESFTDGSFSFGGSGIGVDDAGLGDRFSFSGFDCLGAFSWGGFLTRPKEDSQNKSGGPAESS